MSGLTNTVLAQQVQALLDTQKRQSDYLTTWLGGSADGGPNLDGRYPFVDLSGVEILVPSPATFNDMVAGPAAMADVAKVAAELARDLAQSHADRADAQRILSEAARGASIDARNLAQEHRNQAGTHEANARYWAEQAQGSGEGSSEDRAIVEQLAADTSDNAAQASQDALNAAASAALAATFEPDLYQQKTDLLAADRITGVLSVDRIPVLPSQRQFMSSGSLSALTSGQQSEIGRGSVVTTTDGMRYVYSGEGSKTVAASYTVLADITPDWNVISGRPSQFPPTAHTHPWADVTGKPTTFAPSAHAHEWTSITDKPNVAIRNVYNDFLGVTARDGTGGYVNLAAGNADWTGYIQFFHANGNRAGYIGFANASGNQIRLVADGAGGFSFSHRPDFNGAVPWDGLNLPGPATTNTVQQINARKVFKDGVAGTATSGNASYVDRAVEIQSLGSTSDALIAFHIPGVRGETFGVRANGDWVVSNGVSPRKLWHEGNFDPASKLNITGGNITGNLALQKATPILYLNDTNASGALGRFRFYSAANNFYFTRNTDASGGWGTEDTIFRTSSVNGTVTMETPVSFSTTATFNSDVTFNGGSIVNSNWWRSTGQTGWFNSTYGTGIYSIAAGSVRTYNNASFTAEGSLNTLTANIYQNNGANRVPVTTVSQSPPSGGVDGDVHIVW